MCVGTSFYDLKCINWIIFFAATDRQLQSDDEKFHNSFLNHVEKKIFRNERIQQNSFYDFAINKTVNFMELYAYVLSLFFKFYDGNCIIHLQFTKLSLGYTRSHIRDRVEKEHISISNNISRFFYCYEHLNFFIKHNRTWIFNVHHAILSILRKNIKKITKIKVICCIGKKLEDLCRHSLANLIFSVDE